MDPERRSALRAQVEVYLQKFPHASTVEIKNWIRSGEQIPGVEDISMNTMNRFILRLKKKFEASGNCAKHAGGNGRPSISRAIAARGKRLGINKKNRSLRNISEQTRISHQSVKNILNKAGCKPYHKYKTQKMSDQHKINWVSSAQKLLRRYGSQYRAGRSWSRLVNTDFSAKIKTCPTRNSKNDIIWSTSREAAGDLLESNEEKFSLGEMIWGGVSSKGLIPKSSPIFVSELCNQYDPKPKTVNSEIYTDMIKEQVGPAILEVYPDGQAIFQDDGATIHRARISMDAVHETFKHRVDPADQASKMADIWPIENVWGIIKAKIDQTQTNNLQHLKRKIKSVWKEIDSDKDLCRRLMSSIPKRLAAVVQKQGSQITKDDY